MAALTEDETPRLGAWCIDGGKCHHDCSQKEGCMRRSCCVPLSMSGLDDQWRTPAEAAEDEARAISAAAPAPAGLPRSKAPSL